MRIYLLVIVPNLGYYCGMLIIGHRGAAGASPENSLKALEDGVAMGADMLEFDVQITRDKIPIVIHDSTLLRTHRKAHIVKWSTHASIIEATEKGHKIATLEEVLDKFFGKVLLNLEFKSRGSASIATKLLKERYIKQPDDWQNVLLSSFKPSELLVARKISPEAEISMLHYRNPFTFIAYQRRLDLAAVGFHRLYINPLALEVAKQLGLFTYVYTVNRPAALEPLTKKSIDGIVTDHPKDMRSHFENLRVV